LEELIATIRRCKYVNEYLFTVVLFASLLEGPYIRCARLEWAARVFEGLVQACCDDIADRYVWRVPTIITIDTAVKPFDATIS
jgi:hypothetical protein